MNTPTLDQLKRSIAIAEQIEALQKELAGIFGSLSAPSAKAAGKTGRRKMSAKARALIGAAQKARWAKLKGKKAPQKKKSKLSAQGLANIKAAQKKRWAKIKSGKKAQAPAKKKKPAMSAAAKAKLSAMMKARWEAAKKSGGPLPNAGK